MSKTLLEITQDILSGMTSDEINSITDTAEGEAVARIVMETFDNIVSNRDWSRHKQLLKLTAFSDSDRPTHFTVPTNMKELLMVNYDNARVSDSRLYYEPVRWKEPDQFLAYTNARNSTATTVQVVTDPTGVKLLIANNGHPKYYTSFDDETIVMDSFESDVDSTLQESRLQAFGYIQPEASFDNDWVPDLPKDAFALLLQEALSTARYRIDSETDEKAEQNARRQDRWLSRKQWAVNGGIKYPDYGRKSNKYRRDVTFNRDR